MNCNECKWNIQGHKRWSAHMRGCEHPNAHRMERGIAQVGVTVTDGAMENGWFDFPFNFDPVWIEDCKGFEK